MTNNDYLIKLSFDAIEKILGKGNFDEMDNYLYDILLDILPSNAVYADMIKFVDLNTEHENPYFHYMVFCLENVDLVTVDLLKNELRKQNLLFD